VIGHRFKWKRASMAAALCYGSRGGGAQLAFYHQVGAYDTQTLANLAADTLQEVIAAAERGVQWIRGTHHLAFSLVGRCGLFLW
jgi:hypothetical protein